MRFASVPQPWLRDALKMRFPKLNAYTEQWLREPIENTRRLWTSGATKQTTPAAGQAAAALGRSVVDWAIPSLRHTITQDMSLDRATYEKDERPVSSSLLSSLLSPTILVPLGAVAGIALGIAMYVSISAEDSKGPRGETTFRAHEYDFLSPTTLADLGESGAMLSALGTAFDQETQVEREKERTGGAPLVEIDVDVENDKGEVARDIMYKR